MIKKVIFLLGHAWVIAALVRSSRAGWQALHRRQRDEFAARLGENPDQIVALINEVEPLWATDPGKAERMLQAHYVSVRERDAARRAALWKRAASDPTAAGELKAALAEDLETHHSARRELERSRKVIPEVLEEIDAEMASTRRQMVVLAKLRRTP
jgi:hypothetical protein